MIDFQQLDSNLDLFSHLTRDDGYIKGLLKETQGGEILASKPLQIHFPEHYMHIQELFMLDTYINMAGVFAIVEPESKKYAVFKIPARVFIPANTTLRYKNKETDYRYLEFARGDTVILSNQIIMDDKFEYFLYNFFVANGYIPWFFNYLDLLTLFDQSHYYIGRTLGASSQIVEMIFSNIARNPKEASQIYRGSIQSMADIYRNPPTWVGLRNISLGAVDTFSKIMGAYYKEGLNSALIEKSKKLTDMERVLRA